MSGRSARKRLALLFLLLPLAPRSALAHGENFFSGSPLGLGLVGGAGNRPRSDFVAGGQTTSSPYASYFAAEPFLDFGNFSFRAHTGWHFYPLLSGAGSDAHGSFTESSDAGSFDYGVRVQFCPFLSEDARERFYFIVGYQQSNAKLKNLRKYSSGAMAGTTNTARLAGGGAGLNGGVGVEFFAIQNWSVALEAGYSSLSVNNFTYQTSTDETGAPVASGTNAKDAAGNDKRLRDASPYAQLTLNLNL